MNDPDQTDPNATEPSPAANLDHPNIVPVYDVGSSEQFLVFVVSKYIDGTDLFTRLKQSRLPLGEAAEPCGPWRLLGVPRRGLPDGEPRLQRAGGPNTLRRLPASGGSFH